jgi:hypothetical protein
MLLTKDRWRDLHNEELHKLHPSPIMKVTLLKIIMCRACNTHGERRNAYRVLVGTPKGKRTLGKPRRR